MEGSLHPPPGARPFEREGRGIRETPGRVQGPARARTRTRPRLPSRIGPRRRGRGALLAFPAADAALHPSRVGLPRVPAPRARGERHHARVRIAAADDGDGDVRWLGPRAAPAAAESSRKRRPRVSPSAVALSRWAGRGAEVAHSIPSFACTGPQAERAAAWAAVAGEPERRTTTTHGGDWARVDFSVRGPRPPRGEAATVRDSTRPLRL